MSDVILTNMMWLNKGRDFDWEVIKRKLTVIVEPYTGTRYQVKFYQENPHFLGVPRVWGAKEFPDLEVIDCTTYPEINFPLMQWPEGKSYWSGQKEAVDDIVKVFKTKTGALLESPCGSGKTLQALSIAELMHTLTLILIHKNDLAKQWHETAREFWPGIEIGHVQQKKWDYKGRHIVTAMAQTLYSQIDKIPPDFLTTFGLVIYDEGHRYPARTFEAVMRLPDARYRLAVSATWRRNDGLERVWRWHVGKVESKARISRLGGDYCQLNWGTSVKDSMFMAGGKINRGRYVTVISQNIPFLNWLVTQITKGVQAGRTVLVVGERVEQCKRLRSKYMLDSVHKGKTPSIGLYLGEMSKEERESVKNAGYDVVVTTYQMVSEGTDMPELDTLFLATPRGDVEQIVGRIQRHFGDKKRLLIVDPVFNTPWNWRLAKKRQKQYERLGFKEQK